MKVTWRQPQNRQQKYNIREEISTYITQSKFDFRYSESGGSKEGFRGAGSLRPPPPPTRKNLQNLRACPLCRKPKIQNEVLLPTCGMVFCYKCILSHLRETHRCPITKLPANETHFFLLNPAPYTQFRDPGVRPAPRGAFRLRGKEVVFF